ncbi:hypothetical protein [Rubripirellula reticaptiva]|uniref:Competence protein A n=1 Tax=Rubripirellula reticaptiva TaxID=2528013 RepID=A0A5C6EP58_9BACT|nr:hypothetical protein [Rubripirellula reticaptiva]TWU49797.1 hypothetical protein Poly59_44220 [Rubripirellula reticaptiva]
MRHPLSLSSLATKAGTALSGGRRRTRFVGIDIGIDRVTVASMGWSSSPARSSGKALTLGWMSRSQFKLPMDPWDPPQSDWVETVTEVLQSQLPRCIDGHRVAAAISLPPTWVHYQTIVPSEIDATRRQCDLMFGSSLFKSAAHLNHWPVVAGCEPRLIAATSSSAAVAVAQSVASVGYEVQSILPHGAALWHASSVTAIAPSAILLLEPVGGLIALPSSLGDSSNPPSCGLCRVLPVCESDAVRSNHCDELEPWLDTVAQEYEATIRYANRVGAEIDTQSPVLIAGRLAAIAGVGRMLASMINRPVATWRYAGRIRPSDSRNADCLGDACEAIALSLAYCAVGLVSRPSGASR